MAVVVILLGVVVFLGMKLWKRKRTEAKYANDALGYDGLGKEQSTAHTVGSSPAEMYGESPPVEIGQDSAVELPGHNIDTAHNRSRAVD